MPRLSYLLQSSGMTVRLVTFRCRGLGSERSCWPAAPRIFGWRLGVLSWWLLLLSAPITTSSPLWGASLSGDMGIRKGKERSAPALFSLSLF